MKKNIVLVFLSLLLLAGCDSKVIEEEQLPNVINFKDQTVNNLQLSGINLTYKDGICEFIANVKNNSSKSVTLSVIQIKLYDKDDNLLVKTVGYIGNKISKKENKQIITNINGDLRKSKRVEFKIIPRKY